MFIIINEKNIVLKNAKHLPKLFSSEEVAQEHCCHANEVSQRGFLKGKWTVTPVELIEEED